MAHEALEGINIAILVTDGFEQVELIRPRKTLEEAGVTTNVVSPKVCAQLQFSRATAGEPAAIPNPRRPELARRAADRAVLSRLPVHASRHSEFSRRKAI